MYVLSFFIILGVATYFTNKTNEVESNYEFLHWSKKDILIIACAFGASVLLEILSGLFLPKFFVIVYAILAVLAIMYVNKNREDYIREYKKQIDQVIESVGKLTSLKEKDIDYNDLPFEIHKDGDLINEIVLTMKDPSKFNDGTCTNAVYSLKRYFPYFDWQYKNDFPKQQCVFEGQKLPPHIAHWPGSDYRTGNFIPLGLSGNGEVGWPLTSKDYGESSYIYDDGKPADTVQLAYAPQALCLGSTGGGKAIWTEQELW